MTILVDQERNRLLSAWQKLAKEEQRTVRLFAEFLAQQSSTALSQQEIPQEPLSIPKPEHESAVLAMKRLKKSYPMIEADFSLLETASQLLLKRIMGTPDAEVIAELEELFAKRYLAWKEERAQTISS
ncbi:Crp/Fnr family transcriptional regulator [Candidatus Magnetaquicoccus inordinatus]|uniref:Crp/Fnr family transcriptional regulator n=1 Tax=Candidatus Magnetaquicoccus inordinatus TaxID=2496818 RepID=UPI00102BCD29|nr:Crp/Fnr family transcriptional regulator [Candidatus Magnetaquicoccus inordinatus]